MPTIRVAHRTTVPTARKGRPWLVLLALLLVVLAAYQPAWRGGLVWDDDAHVTAPARQSWSGLARTWFDLRATLQYYPLLHTAFWVEHRLWGDATLGYHLINILEHFGAALLLASILRRLAVPGAYLAAGIFALHPVQVESVAWIAEQKNTLSGLFYMAAALAYLRYDERREARWYVAAASVFVCALLCKTVTATLPGALLVVFWWRRGRLSWRGDVLPLAPFFAVGASLATITAWFELAVNNSTGPDFQFTAAERVLIAGRGIWFHLGKLCWPSGLAFMYPRWELDTGAWWQWAFPAGAVALAFALWAIRERSRAPLAAFLFFCGTLVPVLGFFNLYTFRYSLIANHYQYLACIGPIALAAALVTTLLGRITTPAPRVAIAGALLLLLAGVTRLEAAKFESQEALMQDTIAKDPRSWFAYTNLGTLRLARGHAGEARAYFERALELKPGFAVAYNDLGNAYLREGDVANALRNHRRAVELQPDYVEARSNLGIDLVRTGQLAEGIASYRRALDLDPRYVMAHYNLANALVRAGDAEGAEQHYRQVIAIAPDFALAYYFLGMQLLSQQRAEEAGELLRHAFRLKPDFAQGYYELGNLQLRQGRAADAMASYTRALQIDPDYAEAHCNLGATFAAQGRIGEAIEEYRAALRARPDYAVALNNLGSALERQGRVEEAASQYQAVLRFEPGNAKARENLERVRRAPRKK
jgi:tetratricopeptide (TPR) repeat protein